MKNRHLYILSILTVLILTACADDDLALSSSQQALIGRGVNFNTSWTDPFTTRTTYRNDGSFNQDDRMRIFRQYSEDNGQTFDATTEAFRTYSLQTKYATGTSISLETNWKPLKGGLGSDKPGDTFTQTESDSLTWENGKTVRFRSWARSNLSDCLINGSKGLFYPDYSVAEWVTVSGPTMDIPLTLKHIGCRIGFAQKAGNQLYSAEICTDWQDYKRADNADTNNNDNASTEAGKTDEEAKKECAQVVAAYNRMCMPAGVDMNTQLLNSLTKKKYSATSNFSDIESSDDGIVSFGTQEATYIADSVQRPVFTSNLNGRLYMVSIPYDMSKGENSGETIVLPACTRIKVWFFDVNDGDKSNTDDREANYHIFTLSDIKEDDVQLFPNGLTLKPGYSYVFNVGYQYNHITITPADNFSWVQQDAEQMSATDETAKATEPTDYSWWTSAISKAIKETETSTSKYNPVFEINSVKEFVEFINLVNGTAARKTTGIHIEQRSELNPDNNSYYWWVRDSNDSTITKEEALKEGYIFYQHYHPSDADHKAYSIEDILTGPYSFYDGDVGRHFTVKLTADLDFADGLLTAVGNSATTPFSGNFDGQMHTLKNVYMQGGYLFGYAQDASLRNLVIKSVHNTALLNTATTTDKQAGHACYIAGIAMLAPSATNSIASKLDGESSVVGCIHQGNASAALVGSATNLTMYACMQTAAGISKGKGALVGEASIKPQGTKDIKWGSFMVNYYDIERSPGTNAVGSTADDYAPTGIHPRSALPYSQGKERQPPEQRCAL
ncbi:MAG: hypothetical protein ACI4T9_13020 [Prevotella sp.]